MTLNVVVSHLADGYKAELEKSPVLWTQGQTVEEAKARFQDEYADIVALAYCEPTLNFVIQEV